MGLYLHGLHKPRWCIPYLGVRTKKALRFMENARYMMKYGLCMDAQPSTLNQPSPKSWGLEVLVQRIHEAANAQQEDECHSHREANTIGERCQHVGQENAILRAPRTMLCPKKNLGKLMGDLQGCTEDGGCLPTNLSFLRDSGIQWG